MKINSKFFQFDSTPTIRDKGGTKFSEIGIRTIFVQFHLKICILIDSIDEKNSKNSMKINSKFVQFDSTPPLILGV